MCRLLATVSPIPMTIAEVLGDDHPAVFQDMSAFHRDGWGAAWLDADGDIRLERSAESGLGDERLTAALQRSASRAQIVHLRFATSGMVCTLENTHPFLTDGIAFAHNGALVPVDRMDDLIKPEVADQLHGSTDSERYFAVIRSEMAAGASPAEAVVSAVNLLRARYPQASMNALLLTESQLVVVHANSNARIPYAEFAEAEQQGRLPEAHDDRYYRMHLRRGPDGSLSFASTGLDVSDWEELPAESVAVVDLDTMRMRLHPIVPQGSLALA